MSMVDTARQLAPELAATADEADEMRRLPDSTWKLLVDSGLARGLQPARWGGAEAPLVDYMDAVMEVCRVNSSAGWVLGVMGVHPWQLALFDEQAQEDMWGVDPTRNHSSSYSPTGTATRVEGGYQVSGRWSFSSGCDHGHAVNLGAITGSIDMGDGVQIPDMRSLLLMRDQYRIEDNWHTAGMRGTGSKDIVVEDAFVPDRRTQSHLDYLSWTPLPGQERNSGSLYRINFSVVFNFVLSAAVLGMARGFVDTWTELTSTRVIPTTGPQREDALTQLRLADAEWMLDATIGKLSRHCVEMQDIAERGSRPTDLEMSRARWDVNRGVDLVGERITTLYHAASGRTAYLDHPLHRKFQDIHCGLGHMYLVPDGHGRNHGGLLLGAGVQTLTL